MARRKRLAALGSEARKARAEANRVRAAMADLSAAEEELRKYVAEWVAVIRARITALAMEVSRVNNSARPGTLLARVIDITTLSAVCCELYNADCEAAGEKAALRQSLDQLWASLEWHRPRMKFLHLPRRAA